MYFVDLFAGCGGLSLGFRNAGFQALGAFEFWRAAADCYDANFPNEKTERRDLSDVDGAVAAIREFAVAPDLIVGGPPCQDFSTAGKRVEAEKANLTVCFAKIVSTIKPRFFVMENVARCAQSRAFEAARAIYKAAGYGLTTQVLRASDCGTPQRRKRFFCVGALDFDDDFLRAELLGGLSTRETTLRDYFGDSLGFEFYYRRPRNYNRRAVFSIDEPAPTMRGVNRPVPPGYVGRPNDAAPLDETIRALTIAERASIQTFPADFRWVGSKTDVELMIGNAVPVKLSEYVATTLRKFIEKNESVKSTDVKERR